MRVFEYNELSFPNLIRLIETDVKIMKRTGIEWDNIKVSIPSYLISLINEHCRRFGYYHANGKSIYFYGCEMISGYNNQICVFNKEARPDDEFLEPIEIKYNDKQKTNWEITK